MSLVNFYKIVCNDSGLIYVGSTIQPIEKRLQAHEYNYRLYLENRYNFTTSFTIIEKNNYTIQLIECVECVDRKQRNSIELLHILNENSVNKYQPGRDRKKYKIDNKERIKEQSTQYRQDNKEKIKEQGMQYRQDSKEKIKQYYNDNKENLKEYQRQYQRDNKERIDRKRNEKFICPCGGKYTDRHKSRHMRTKKHIDYLATL